MSKNIHIIFDEDKKPTLDMFGIIIENLDSYEIRGTGNKITVSLTGSAKDFMQWSFQIPAHSFK